MSQSIDELLTFLEENADNLMIIDPIAVNMLGTVEMISRKVYKDNPESKKKLDFFIDTHKMLRSVKTLEHLQDAVIYILHDNVGSDYMTNSRIFFICMKLVIHKMWQLCIQFTETNIEGLEGDNLKKKMIESCNIIKEQCSKERGIIFP